MKAMICAITLAAAFALVVAGCAPSRRSGVADSSDTPQEIFQPQIIATPTAEAVAEREITAPPLGAHYRVGKTDTAKSIALRFYGDDRYAEDILELNKEAVRKARGLKPGMVIALPPVRERDKTARP